MRQKCPNCGAWCYAEERSFWDKAGQSHIDFVNRSTNYGEKIGGVFGKRGENLGRKIGQLTGLLGSTTFIGSAKSIVGGLSDFDCHFCCHECGYEWGANIEEDQSEELDAEEKELIDKIRENVLKANNEKDYHLIESLCKELDGHDCAESYYWRAMAQQQIAHFYQDKYLETSDERDNETCDKWLNRAFATIKQDVAFYNGEAEFYIEKDGGFASERAYLLYADIVWDLARGVNDYVVARNMFIMAMDTEFDVIKHSAISGYEKCTNALCMSFDYYLIIDDYVELLNSPEEDKRQMAKKEIETAEKDRFSNIPFHDRQFVFITKAGSDSISGCVDEDEIIQYVFTIDQLPMELAFPVGHPQPNTLYVANPVKKGYYVPYCDAEETFFHEKVDDFIRLSQCLGAMEITFRSLKGQSIAESFLSSGNYNVGGSINSNSVSGGYSQKISGNGSCDSSKSVELSRKYDPIKYPYCPDDIEWLRFDPSWQSFVKQRLEGNTLEASMRISSTETISSNGNTIKNVKAAFECMMGKVDADYDSEEDNTFSQTESTEWQISVKFRSIRDFTEQSQLPPQKVLPLQLSPAEVKYKEEFLFMLEDGGIGDAERRLLERKRQKFGVSEERAKMIEESCAPSLSEEEKEYIEIYKDMLEDGEISERRRKILKKEAESLGISPSRAKELEEMI